jgi:hypothetical protein
MEHPVIYAKKHNRSRKYGYSCRNRVAAYSYMYTYQRVSGLESLLLNECAICYITLTHRTDTYFKLSFLTGFSTATVENPGKCL